MFIKVQGRLGLVNLDRVNSIYMSENKEDFDLFAEMSGTTIQIAKFKSYEKAFDAFDEIMMKLPVMSLVEDEK